MKERIRQAFSVFVNGRTPESQLPRCDTCNGIIWAWQTYEFENTSDSDGESYEKLWHYRKRCLPTGGN